MNKSYKGDILVVDDQLATLKVLTFMLTERGYRVRQAISGPLALKAVQKSPPDLILLDILMPDMDGYEVCERLKADEGTRDIPVIFISVLEETQDKVRSFAVGGVDYVSSPFQEEEVLARVATHLALWKAQKEIKEKNLQLQQEITERKQVEEALRESEERLRQIVQQMPYPVEVHTPDGTATMVNQAFLDMFRIPSADLVVGKYNVFNDPLVMEELGLRDDIKRVYSGETVFVPEIAVTLEHIEDQYGVKGRGVVIQEATMFPVFRRSGEIWRVVAIWKDITERKRAEEERQRLYEQAQRDAETKATLLREVNHRVKNNLTAIIGLLHIEQEYARMADQAAYEAILQSLTVRIGGLATVHSLLTASEWAPLPLSDLAGQVIKSAMQIRPRDKQVFIDVPPSPLRVTPDQAHNLALVINELATNTIKHALPGRTEARISVRIALEDDVVLFEYRDNGPGYPEDVLRLERHAAGFDLIKNLTRQSLRGELSLHNDDGAVAVIRFPAQALGGTTNEQSKDDPHTDR